MATIVETGIQNIVVSVMQPDPLLPLRMLITCETVDADGQVIRQITFPDWWGNMIEADQLAIADMYQRFYGYASVELGIDLPEEPPEEPPAEPGE